MKKITISNAILGLWTLILLGLLFLPALDSLLPVRDWFHHFDKVAHFGLFAVTGFVGIYGASFFSRFRSRMLFGVVFGLALAVGTELGQHFIPSRDMDFYDLLADWAGLFFGLFAYTFYYIWRLKI
jgi:VanZ family protein